MEAEADFCITSGRERDEDPVVWYAFTDKTWELILSMT